MSTTAPTSTVAKAPTGIDGLDEITGGGLPAGRTTLVCGGAGSGKTMLATAFLVGGAVRFDEPGVFITFEESEEELVQNARSVGFDLDDLVARRLLAIDYVRIERSEIEETGGYDLEGLFIRLGLAIDSVGAKRIVLDTIETLFAGLSDAAVLRAEIRRLFRWLKDRGITTMVTGERGSGQLTRHGLEEYVSDCVILLDQRVSEQLSTRRLRIVKYRGTNHGTNEYPFLIDSTGVSVLPVTSLGLEHDASEDRISSGVPRLDTMLGGEGFYRGTGILVSGSPGTGKTSMAAAFADATCRRGERCLFFAYEESRQQVVRNMRSIGIDLQPWIDAGLLEFHASRPTLFGLESHLLSIQKRVDAFDPETVVVDPLSTFAASGTVPEVRGMLLRVIDFLKSRQITALFTAQTSSDKGTGLSSIDISSLIDSWLLLRFTEVGGERNRALYVLKSRGMAHSNQVRELRFSGSGIDLVDVYGGPEGVLTGSMRVAQEARERASAMARRQEREGAQRKAERKRRVLQAQMEALRSELEAITEEAELGARLYEQEEERLEAERAEMLRRRFADAGSSSPQPEQP